MRILAFSDLHRNRAVAEQVASMSELADIVVGAGDFATLGVGLEDTVSVLRRVTVPMVVVPGNHDALEELRQAFARQPNIHVLHGDVVHLNGATVAGLGFEIAEKPAALAESYLSEAEAAAYLGRLVRADLLVSHAPPHGVADVQRDSTHQGSRAIARWIGTTRPQLCLCGHIHHAWGTYGVIGQTRVHNVGPTPSWFEIDAQVSVD